MPIFDPAILLLQLGILLALAFLLGRLAERIGLPATTGELATGLLLGPSVLGAVATAQGSDWLFAPASGQNEFLRGIAAFCGVLLVGVAGATVDVGFVRARSRTVGLISLGRAWACRWCRPWSSRWPPTLGCVDPRRARGPSRRSRASRCR